MENINNQNNATGYQTYNAFNNSSYNFVEKINENFRKSNNNENTKSFTQNNLFQSSSLQKDHSRDTEKATHFFANVRSNSLDADIKLKKVTDSERKNNSNNTIIVKNSNHEGNNSSGALPKSRNLAFRSVIRGKTIDGNMNESNTERILSKLKISQQKALLNKLTDQDFNYNFGIVTNHSNYNQDKKTFSDNEKEIIVDHDRNIHYDNLKPWKNAEESNRKSDPNMCSETILGNFQNNPDISFNKTYQDNLMKRKTIDKNSSQDRVGNPGYVINQSNLSSFDLKTSFLEKTSKMVNNVKKLSLKSKRPNFVKNMNTTERQLFLNFGKEKTSRKSQERQAILASTNISKNKIDEDRKEILKKFLKENQMNVFKKAPPKFD